MDSGIANTGGSPTVDVVMSKAGAGSGAGAGNGAGGGGLSKAAAEAAAKKAAAKKALLAKLPMPTCTSSRAHLLTPIYKSAGSTDRKTLDEIMKGVNPLILKAVKDAKLPPMLSAFRAQYAKFGHRNPFLWNWLFYSTQLMAMPTVPAEHHDAVTLLKSLINMFNVVTDDIGDEDNDIRLLHRIEADFFDGVFDATDAEESKAEAGAAGPRSAKRRRTASSEDVSSGTAGADENLKAQFCHDLKTQVWKLARSLPRWSELHELLEYDVRQMLNEKRFSALTNRHPDMINRTEHSLYAPHTMHAMIFLTCDAMASPSVDAKELGMLRSIYWDANVMANLANCLGTWTREIPKRDWSSPLFPQAIEDGLFTIKELADLSVEDIEARIKASPVEGKLLARWYNCHAHILSFADRIKSSSAADFAKQNEAFLAMHLACRGFI